MTSFNGNSTAPESAKVVKIDAARPGLRLSPIRQAEAYWSALRDGAAIPRRAQVDPRGLQNLLEFAFIIEHVAPGIARFRLAGQHLCLMSGMEVRGMPISALFTPLSRASLGAALEQVFENPSVAELTLKSEPRHGRTPITAQMILLPLKSDLGDITRALGVIVSDCEQGGAPNRFDVTSSLFRPVSGLSYAMDPGPAPTPAPAAKPRYDMAQGPVSLPAFAQPKATFRRGKPHLRLVKTD